MTARARPVPGSSESESLEPYRHLAVRVIAQALRDASVLPAGECRESARTFLAGTPMFAYWCGVAAFDPEAVRTRMTLLRAAGWRRGARHAHAHSD